VKDFQNRRELYLQVENNNGTISEKYTMSKIAQCDQKKVEKVKVEVQ
jgi:hypothetical protein